MIFLDITLNESTLSERIMVALEKVTHIKYIIQKLNMRDNTQFLILQHL